MNVVRSSILAAVGLFFIAAGAFAFVGDFGVTLDGLALPRSGVVDTTYQSEFRTAAWGELLQPTEKGGSLDLLAQVSYRCTEDRAYIFDVDLLRFAGLFTTAFGEGTALELKAGRFNFSDATKLILDETMDGVQLGFLFSGWQVSLAGAYSGFLLNPSSNVRISADDWLEAGNNSEFFGPKRLVAQAMIGTETFALQALAQFDMRGGDYGEKINTQYLGIAGAPRLDRHFYLDYSLTAGYGQSTVADKTTNIISALGSLGLQFYAEELSESRGHARVAYATGFTPLVLLTENLSLDDFRPITQPTLGLAFSPRLANLLYLDVGYSFRPFAGNPSTPLSNIEPLAGIRVYFRDPIPLLASGAAADVLVRDIDLNSNALYLGTEIEAGVLARVFSDLGLSARGAVFIPNSDAFTSDRGLGFVLKLEASVAM